MRKQSRVLWGTTGITAALMLLVFATRERKPSAQGEIVIVGWSHRGALGYGHMEVNLKTGLVSVPTVPASYVPWPPGWRGFATASEIQALCGAVEAARLDAFTPGRGRPVRDSDIRGKAGAELTGSILFIEWKAKRKVFLLPQEMPFPTKALQLSASYPEHAQKAYVQMNSIMATMFAIVSDLDPTLKKTDKTFSKGDARTREAEYNVVRGRIDALWDQALPVAVDGIKTNGRQEQAARSPSPTARGPAPDRGDR